MTVSSVFAADFVPLQRPVLSVKTRGPLPGSLCLPTGDKITRAKLRKFALACGVLVLFWNFSGYLEQILWIPLIAFALSIQSVYFYCRYLDSDRCTAEYLVISLLLFSRL
jgi:hypothetical protein